MLAMIPPYAFALDAPHTNAPGYDIQCGNCHWTNSAATPPWASIAFSPAPADDTINNRRCWACHTGGKAPAVATHSASSTSSVKWAPEGWTTECVTCHNPHQQRQTRAWGAASYLVTGGGPVTVGGYTSGTNTTEIILSGALTNNYFGYYLLPDKNYPFYYRIKSDTTNTAVVQLKGQVNSAYVKTGGYAIVYAKNVNELVSYRNPGNVTVGGQVKLFSPSGTNGPGDSDKPTSVCLVCHTKENHWSAGGDTAHNDRGECKDCHTHPLGFKATCGNCHGGPPVLDTPTWPNGLVWTTPTGSATAGAHYTHVNVKGIVCSACHFNSVATGPTHNSGKITMGFYNLGGTTQGGIYDGQTLVNYDFTITSPETIVSNLGGLKTCSNVYCHGASMAPNGGSNTTPVWDDPNTAVCGTCHGATVTAPPQLGSHVMHTSSTTGYSFGCTLCHKTAAGQHINGTVDWAFDTGDARTNGGKYQNAASGSTGTPAPSGTYQSCTNLYCHSSGESTPFSYATPTWGNAASGACGTCHGTVAAAPPASASHAKHVDTAAGYKFSCSKCHNATVTATADSTVRPTIKDKTFHVNGSGDVSFDTYNDGGSYNGAGCSNLYCHSNGTSVTTGAIPANTSANWGSGPLSCDSCHGNPPSYANGSPKPNSHPAHGGRSCDKCHSGTTSNGTSITDSSKHVNKSYDLEAGSGISFSYAYDASGGSCANISCHSNASGKWGTSACLDCHSVAQGNRAAITPQFSANSHHIQGTISNDKCYQCHWEANSDGSINTAYHGGSANPGSPVDLVIYGAGARPTTYGAGTTAVQYTANGSRAQILGINSHCLGCHNENNKTTKPFGDDKTPAQYSWDGYSVDAKYSSTSTTPWGKYNTGNVTPKNTQTKAYSAHGNALNNQGGWNLSETWPNTRGGATGGTASIACFDCHNSHGSNAGDSSHPATSYPAGSGTIAGGILKNTTANKGGYTMTYLPSTGGSSANHNAYNPGAALCFDCHMTQNSGATPWGYQSTFGATQPIMSYWESPYWDAGTMAFASQQRYPYKASSGNQGGHFGASSPLTNGDGTSPINGLCTPCHDPHGVSPTIGANAPYAVPLLKGTFMTSPYKEDASPAITFIGVTKGTSIQTLNGYQTGPGCRGLCGGGNSDASYPSYNIDENTFDSWIWNGTSRISENVSQFGGLCIQCHPQSILNPKADTHTQDYGWKTMNRVHNTVQGWGGQGANAGNATHSYTCSKCHTVHNSRLPRLMVTNCLDYSHRNGATTGGWPSQGSANGNGSGHFGYGSGSGNWQFPAGGSGTSNSSGFGFGATTCHAATNGNAWPSNQQWNTKTNWASAPAVNFISPNVRAQGTPQVIVNIYGSGFQSGATVSFNDVGIKNVTVTYVTFTTLTVSLTVDVNAALGTHNVTVTNPDLESGTGTGVFIVTAPPAVTLISPISIAQGSPETTVTIEGIGFQRDATVSFNDAGITSGAATFVNSTTLTIPVTVHNSATLGPHPVTVTNPDGGTGTGNNLFSVSTNIPPTVTSTSPTSRPQGSAQGTITITGAGFQSGAIVSFNDRNITVGASSLLNSTTLTVPVTVGQGATLGAHNVTVDTGTGINLFTVTACPQITSVSPNVRGQNAAEVAVIISGNNFQSGAWVSFDDLNIRPGSTSFVNSTTLTVPVTVDAGAALGAHNVTVNNPDGGSGTKTGAFTVSAPPAVTSTSPNRLGQGSAEQAVYIYGSNFQNGATVSFGDPNIVIWYYCGSIACFVDSRTLIEPVQVLSSALAGPHNVTVTNPDGGTSTGTGVFTVGAAPVVTSTTPNAIRQGSAQQIVTITGNFFQSGATVSFGDANITLGAVTVVSSTMLTVPVTVGLSATAGPHNVTVTNPDGGIGTGTGVFTVTMLPTITSTSPNSLPQGSTMQTVTITGTGFQSGAWVSFDDSNIMKGSAVNFVSSTTLTVAIQVGSSATVGAHNVTVTNPDGGTYTGIGLFTVTPVTLPTITATSPNSIPQGKAWNGSPTVTITGTGFQYFATVSFNDPNILLGASPQVVNSTTITVPVRVLQGATVGTHNVTVSNPDGGTGTGNSVFTVTAGPQITSISPNSRVRGSSATETITGTGFQSGATVSFGDGSITVGAVTVVNPTTITVPVTVGASAGLYTHDVIVTNPDGGEGIVNLFTVTAPPTVTAASPNTISPGSSETTVTITGTGFESGATVSFNDPNITLGAVTFVDSTTLTVPVTVGQGATAGAHDVTVNNPDGGSGTGSGVFTVVSAPTVSSTSPNWLASGSPQTTVTLSGSNFQSGATVSFNDPNIALGAVTFVDSTTLTVPVTVGQGATVGAHSVTVINPDGGSGFGSGVFTVTPATGPQVTTASPNSLPQGSAQYLVYICGTGFQNGATVSFNDPNITLGPVSFVNSTTLTVPVTVGQGATTGPHDVIVINPDGSSGFGFGVLTVNSVNIAPAVVSTSPLGIRAGSAQTTVTINGYGFQSGATVSFNDANILQGPVTFVSPTTLTVPVTVGPSAMAGAHNVTVTNPDGGIGNGAVVFYVGPPPPPLAPPVPTLIEQAGQSTACTTAYNHTFTWNPVTGGDGLPAVYHVQVSTDSTFTTVNYDSGPGWLATNSWTVNNMPAGNNWYWRVQAADQSVIQPSDYSSPAYFYDSYNSCP